MSTAVYSFQIADAPFDPEVGEEVRPLGSRAEVAARLTELLPGTEFDRGGHAVFHRAAYEIEFTIHTDPVTAVGVTMTEAGGFMPLARIVDKTGWSVIDVDSRRSIDVEASRKAGTIVFEGDGATAVTSHTGTTGRLFGSSRARRLVIAAAVIVLVVVVGRPLLSANDRFELPSILAMRRPSAARFEKYDDRARRRETVAKRLAPAFRNDPIVAQMIDVQMASRAYWNFIDGRFSSPALLSDTAVWARFQMPSFLPAKFAEQQRDGYAFEFRGENCEESEPGWPECASYVYVAHPVKADKDEEGTQPPSATFALFSADDRIHFRQDGRTPRRTDPTIDAR